MTAKVVLFGAGATGRGHVGLLAWQAGAELVLVDKKPELVKALQESGSYTVRLFGMKTEEVQVTGFRAYLSDQLLAIAQEIVDAQAVLTAVFDQNLANVAQTLALAVHACRLESRSTPLNVIACENMMDSSSTLGNHVRRLLKGKNLEYCHNLWGFPDCMISRVVPQPEADPLHIVTENYNEWTARRETFKGEKPSVLRALELVDNQTARLERKLFIHNGGHAVCGYIGYQRGHQYIHQAVHDPVVAQHVLGALDELGEVVRFKHGFSMESIKEYEQDLVRRGSIAEMKDEIQRVIRDPLRKLTARERLVAPALLAVEYGLPRTWIVKGIVAAWRYYYQEYEPEVLALPVDEFLANFRERLSQTSGLEDGHPLGKEIIDEWETK